MEKPVLGANTFVSFESLGKQSTDGIASDPNFKGFSTVGSKLFTPQKAEEDGEGGDAEDYEPDVQFQPVIPLPELVEVKTGEEDEDILFSERSKLFRYVPESKEWKERGIGEFKILKNRASGKIRFLMRREQVHKICCNHNLTVDIEIKHMATSDKAWTWTAPDFSEGEIKNEVFSLRFKNADIAGTFKTVVDDCQKELKNKPLVSSRTVPQTTDSTNPSKGGSLADFAAAQKSGSWECEGCLTRNDNAKIQCLACEGAKPGCEEEVKKLKEAAKPAAAVMTIGAGGGFKFGSVGDPLLPHQHQVSVSELQNPPLKCQRRILLNLRLEPRTPMSLVLVGLEQVQESTMRVQPLRMIFTKRTRERIYTLNLLFHSQRKLMLELVKRKKLFSTHTKLRFSDLLTENGRNVELGILRF